MATPYILTENSPLYSFSVRDVGGKEGLNRLSNILQGELNLAIGMHEATIL
jgi:hypothetical protein